MIVISDDVRTDADMNIDMKADVKVNTEKLTRVQKKEKRHTDANRAAGYGLLIALALVLSYVESRLPAFFAVPGMKLGITNILVIFASYRMGERQAIIVNFLRVFLVSVLFGNVMSLSYSLAGAALSAAVMIPLKRTGRFGIAAVSIAGGIAHNIGQILMAMWLLGTGAVLWYMTALWFSGIAAGAVIGAAGAQLVKRIPERYIDGLC